MALAKPKEYINDEGFTYLGHSYRLRLVESSDEANTPALRLQGGWFLLRCDEREQAMLHFLRWYSTHGKP